MPYQCSTCGAVNQDDASFCSNCGAPAVTSQMAVVNNSGGSVQQKMCVSCHRSMNATFSVCPFCGVTQPTAMSAMNYSAPIQTGTHNKTTAGLLAIFLGGVGVHKFYLGQTGQGILYLLFCWTGIPAILGLVEGIIYLTLTNQDFWQKYH